MTQKSLHWNGSTIGDANALTVAAADGIGYRLGNILYVSPTLELMNRALFNGTGNRGVLVGIVGITNELEVTGIGTPVQVDDGEALVYGLLYRNDAPVNVVIASPTSDTRIDRIVVRRDWAAQTARITLLTGIEGGSAPALVQSPSPIGSGIYDIPLAQLSTTTGGVITVTDEREFCIFSTSFKTNEFATAQITDNSVGWVDRATRGKRIFMGGGDLSPGTLGAVFTYYAYGVLIYDFWGTGAWTWYDAYISASAASAWATGGANEEGWNMPGAVDSALQCTFRLPADYAGGAIYSSIWWVNNNAVAASFDLISAVQIYRDGIPWPTWADSSSSYNTAPITDTGAVSAVFRTPALVFSAPSGFTLTAGDMINYWCQYQNPAGAEDISILGVEFYYQGYT